MKLSQVFLLFALASFVICADPQPANNQQQAKPTGDWSCTEDITAKVADKDSLMKLLRNGDKESLEKIYVIGIKDTARTDQETLDNTKAMELVLKTLLSRMSLLLHKEVLKLELNLLLEQNQPPLLLILLLLLPLPQSLLSRTQINIRQELSNIKK